MKDILQTSESHNQQPVTLRLPVHRLNLLRPPLVSLHVHCLDPDQLEVHAQITSSSGMDTSSEAITETSSESDSSQPSSNASSPETTTFASSSLTTPPRATGDGMFFEQLTQWYERETRACHDEESDGPAERTTVHHCIEAS